MRKNVERVVVAIAIGLLLSWNASAESGQSGESGGAEPQVVTDEAKVLLQKVSVELTDTALAQAVSFISSVMPVRAEVLVSQAAALKNVTLRLKDATLAEALRQIAQQAGAKHRLVDGKLLLALPEEWASIDAGTTKFCAYNPGDNPRVLSQHANVTSINTLENGKTRALGHFYLSEGNEDGKNQNSINPEQAQEFAKKLKADLEKIPGGFVGLTFDRDKEEVVAGGQRYNREEFSKKFPTLALWWDMMMNGPQLQEQFVKEAFRKEEIKRIKAQPRDEKQLAALFSVIVPVGVQGASGAQNNPTTVALDETAGIDLLRKVSFSPRTRTVGEVLSRISRHLGDLQIDATQAFGDMPCELDGPQGTVFDVLKKIKEQKGCNYYWEAGKVRAYSSSEFKNLKSSDESFVAWKGQVASAGGPDLEKMTPVEAGKFLKRRGMTALMMRHMDEAQSDLEEALKRDPSLSASGVCLSLAQIADFKKDWKTKLKWLQAAASAAPNSANDLNAYSWELLRSPEQALRDYPLALETAKKASQLAEDKVPAILDTLATAYFENGNATEAVDLQRKAISLLPDTTPSDERKELENHLKEFEIKGGSSAKGIPEK